MTAWYTLISTHMLYVPYIPFQMLYAYQCQRAAGGKKLETSTVYSLASRKFSTQGNSVNWWKYWLLLWKCTRAQLAQCLLFRPRPLYLINLTHKSVFTPIMNIDDKNMFHKNAAKIHTQNLLTSLSSVGAVFSIDIECSNQTFQ